MAMELNDQYGHINDPTQYLICKRFELNFAKLQEINVFMTSMLDRILHLLDTINKRINEVTSRIIGLERHQHRD